MARIRSIKPEFWTDEKVVELSPLARLLFIGMWNFADDAGRMAHSPTRIKLQVLPADSADISALLGEIRGKKLIVVYLVDGQEYLQIVNFERHQKIDKRTPSRIPPPPEVSAEFPRIPTTDQGRDQGREGIKEEKNIVGQEPDVAKQDSRKQLRLQATEVLDFLNAKTGRNYQPCEANLEMIVARLKEGATVDDLRAVVAKKCREWAGDEKMAQYLRPATLFNRTKFANYQGELAPA